MLEHAKTPPTKPIVLSFAVPPTLVPEVRELMQQKGIAEEKEPLSWREALQVQEADIPSICLRGARGREGLTQKQLSQITGIAIPHLSEMENSKRTIGKKNARLLADALNIDPKRLIAL